MIAKTISHYRVLSQLGQGGMGVVYEAEDLRLGRRVALKFLTRHLERDSQSLQRFQREARAASALNHPHICTIYEVDEFEGNHFIAMELLQGQPLDRRIDSQPLSTAEILELGVQIADALAAAHAKGIVHRDIKPGNIFITGRGEAKVLDFGLAQVELSIHSIQPGQSAEPTAGLAPDHLTSPGSALGTVAYMSPEQARGEPLDARTDLFSLGAVIYEMATRTLPFKGNTSAVIFDAILNRAPTPPLRLNPELPPELERIVSKALEKDRDLRYQSAPEMRADLKRLKRDSDSSSISAVRDVSLAVAPRRHRGAWLYAGVALLAVVVVAAAWWLRSSRKAPAAAPPAEWVQLTDFADSATSPTLSPDGRMLAFLRGPSTFISPGQIYVKLLPNGEPVPLSHDGLTKMSPVFSPDGSRIAYSTIDQNFAWSTWVVPVLGGEPQVLLPNSEGLHWISDRDLLFSEIRKGIHMTLVTADASRMQLRDVYNPPRERGMAHRSALSPDRKSVLMTEMDEGGWLPCRLVPFDGASPGAAVGPPSSKCLDAVWSPDGKWMYFAANLGNGFHLWRQAYPRGQAQQITFGPGEQEGIALAPDGHSLVSSVGEAQSTVWLHPSSNEERQISSQGYAIDPLFSSDGKQVFYRLAKETTRGFSSGELYTMDLAGGRSERLLPGFLITAYQVSDDGKLIAFSSYDDKDKPHVWIASLNRRTAPRQISAREADSPFFAPGGVLYYRVLDTGSNWVYRANLDGRSEQKIGNEPVVELFGVSPDGKLLVLWTAVKAEEATAAIVAYRVADGHMVRICALCQPSWSRDGRYFYISFRGASEADPDKTWVIPLPPGEDLPPLPAAGVSPADTLKQITEVKGVLAGFHFGPVTQLSFGPQPSTYVYSRKTVHRNLYRIPLQ